MTQADSTTQTVSLAYPRLIKRIRALAIDSVLIPVAAFAALLIGVSLGVSDTRTKLILILSPIFILEPCMVAFTYGTIGQHLMGIKVTKRNGVDRINIIAATLRFLVKIALGWFSFISVFATRRHQAIHDLVAGSIVTYRDTSKQPAYDVLQERLGRESGYKYPSIWKKIFIIVMYGILSLITMSFLFNYGLSNECLSSESRCTAIDRLVALIIEILFLVALGFIIVLGSRSSLYGCRRKKLSGDN